jgi:hypothetical protein
MPATKPAREMPEWMRNRKLPKWAATGVATLDRREVEAIRNAEHFTAAMSPGGHRIISVRCETLAEARAAKAELDLEHGMWGRRSVVYAIFKGNHFPVPADWKAD